MNDLQKLPALRRLLRVKQKEPPKNTKRLGIKRTVQPDCRLSFNAWAVYIKQMTA